MVLLLLFSILCASFGGALPASTKEDGWYIKRNAEHRQPLPPPSFSEIEKYGAYYVDKRYTAESDERVLYLTFDAGYENGNIEKILNTLKEESVPAAFFILDNLILRNPALVTRMRDEGHLVCNHTLRHRDMTKITDEGEFAHELFALSELYSERIGGTMSLYYRPPEGKYTVENIKMAQKLGFKTVFWSFAYADWDNKNQPSKEAAMQKVLDNTHNGAVVLLHPTSETNAAILPDLIREWRALGYRFGTLDELTAP